MTVKQEYLYENVTKKILKVVFEVLCLILVNWNQICSQNLSKYCSVYIFYLRLQNMMLDIKKKFKPSLDPISQIFEEQQLSILKPIIRDGSIRRQVGYTSSWKQRIFAFLFIPKEKVTCTVYGTNSTKPEEIIDMGLAKLSKKCIEINGQFCFGVVTENRTKYMISLKNPKECLKVFYELVSAQQLLRNFEMWKGGQQRKIPIFKSAERISSTDAEKDEQIEGLKKKMTHDENDHILSSEQNQEQKSNIKYDSKDQCKVEESVQKNKIIEANTADTIDFKLEGKENSKMHSNNIKLDEKEFERIDQVDFEEYKKLQNFEGFKEIEHFKKGRIFQNNNSIFKVVASLNFTQSSRGIIELFAHLEHWNHRIKQSKIIQTIDKGVYKMAFFFHKTGCFTKQRYCQAIVTLYKVPDGYFMTMNTTNKIPPHIKKEQWLHFKLAVRIRGTLENISMKKILFSIETNESSRMTLQFVKEIRNFQDYLKTKMKLPQKLFEVKGTLFE